MKKYALEGEFVEAEAVAIHLGKKSQVWEVSIFQKPNRSYGRCGLRPYP